MRALECVLGKGVAHIILCGTLPELLEELVVDTLLHVNAGAGAATLPVVEVDAEIGPVECIVNVGVVEDDIRALASKLESNLLQIRASSGLHDLSADHRRTCECNFVDVHVRRDSGASNLSEARDNVDDTRRESSLLDKRGGNQSRERGLLSRLQDNTIACGEGGANLPCPHEQGKVPGDDLTANANLVRLAASARQRLGYTDWLLPDVVKGIRCSIDYFTLNLVGPATVVPQTANGAGQVTLPGHGEGLAVVESLDSGEEVGVLLEQVGKLDEKLSSVLWCFLPPGTVESLASSSNCNVDIFLCSLMDRADDLLSGGVDDLKRFAIDPLDELIVDETRSGVSRRN